MGSTGRTRCPPRSVPTQPGRRRRGNASAPPELTGHRHRLNRELPNTSDAQHDGARLEESPAMIRSVDSAYGVETSGLLVSAPCST